jgi:hypothetical protein
MDSAGRGRNRGWTPQGEGEMEVGRRTPPREKEEKGFVYYRRRTELGGKGLAIRTALGRGAPGAGWWLEVCDASASSSGAGWIHRLHQLATLEGVTVSDHALYCLESTRIPAFVFLK